MCATAEWSSDPILFAHRGGRAHAPENSLQAFTTARSMGATGLESDVWCTVDGVPVLHHDGRVGSLFRRRPIGDVPHAAIPASVPTLAELYRTVGPDMQVSLDLKDPAAIHAVLDVARRHRAVESLLGLVAAAREAELPKPSKATMSAEQRRALWAAATPSPPGSIKTTSSSGSANPSE